MMPNAPHFDDDASVGNALRGVPTTCDTRAGRSPHARRLRALTLPARLGFQIHPFPLRPSFTITELLIVMMVIAIMASMSMFALYGVMEDAREARTVAQIAKLNTLLMDRWDGYRTRPVPIKVPPSTSSTPPKYAPAYRLAALRELMRMEMPDRVSDVVMNPVTPGMARPALSQNYFRRVAPTSWTLTTQYQGAECLYLIVSSIREGDSNGLDFFKSSEIGDLDNDGAKEIWDAWGNPIEFIRWPCGFDSPLQPAPTSPAEYVKRNQERPDPFDPLKVDQLFWKMVAASSNPTRLEDANPTNDPFGLFPLIYSAGRDRIYDINSNGSYVYSATVYSPPTSYGANDPYAMINTTNAAGTRMDADGDGKISYFDNISNHFTGNN